MKNNKGFLSVTVLYSFFLVFLSLMMFIIVNTVTNRNLLNNLKKTIKNDISDTNFANYLLNRYEAIGLTKMDNSYRYIGSNPANYVQINNEKYRIIGVIDGKVKLITTSIVSNSWDKNNQNDYTKSSIYTYLNTDYSNRIDLNYIEDATWYVRKLDYNITSTSSTSEIIKAEISEIQNNDVGNIGNTISAKIGLPYISDYIYSGNNSITKENNWLFTSNMWFITSIENNMIQSFYLTNAGIIASANVNESKAIKPCFYLKGNIKYISGTGTESDPYKVG